MRTGVNAGNKSAEANMMIYPELPGWGRRLYSKRNDVRDDSIHIGYTHPDAKPCPCCHMSPVFERYVEDRGVPASVFVAICPRCELRAAGYGTLEQVLDDWNHGRFTDDGWQVHHRLKDVDADAIALLSKKVTADAVSDATDLIETRRKLAKNVRLAKNEFAREAQEQHLKDTMRALREIQHFIEQSPLMLDHDPEAVLSAIRKRVYPDLDTEKRLKVPLDLARM